MALYQLDVDLSITRELTSPSSPTSLLIIERSYNTSSTITKSFNYLLDREVSEHINSWKKNSYSTLVTFSLEIIA